MADLDENIFPIAEFDGQWDSGDPEDSETFQICLFGTKASAFIMDPPEIHKALEASGYRLRLERIESKEQG